MGKEVTVEDAIGRSVNSFSRDRTGPDEATSEVQCSIIVPLHRDGPRFRCNLAHCLAVASTVDAEVIVVSDRKVGGFPSAVVQVVTGSSSDTPPGVKRE